jgi:hypothetical protein
MTGLSSPLINSPREALGVEEVGGRSRKEGEGRKEKGEGRRRR